MLDFLEELRNQASGDTGISDQDAFSIKNQVDKKLADEQVSDYKAQQKAARDVASQNLTRIKQTGYVPILDDQGNHVPATAPNGERVIRHGNTPLHIGEQTGNVYSPNPQGAGFVDATPIRKVDAKTGKVTNDYGHGKKVDTDEVDSDWMKRRSSLDMINKAADLANSNPPADITPLNVAARDTKKKFAQAATDAGLDATKVLTPSDIQGIKDPQKLKAAQDAYDAADQSTKAALAGREAVRQHKILTGGFALHRNILNQGGNLPPEDEARYVDYLSKQQPATVAAAAPAAPDLREEEVPGANEAPETASAAPVAPPQPPQAATAPTEAAPVTAAPSDTSNPNASGQQAQNNAAAAPGPTDQTGQPVTPPAPVAAPTAPPAIAAQPVAVPVQAQPEPVLATPENTKDLPIEQHRALLDSSAQALEAKTADLQQKQDAVFTAVNGRMRSWMVRNKIEIDARKDVENLPSLVRNADGVFVPGPSITVANGMKDAVQKIWNDRNKIDEMTAPGFRYQWNQHMEDMKQHDLAATSYHAKVEAENKVREEAHTKLIADLNSSSFTRPYAQKVEDLRAETQKGVEDISSKNQGPARAGALEAFNKTQNDKAEALLKEAHEAPFKQVIKEQKAYAAYKRAESQGLTEPQEEGTPDPLAPIAKDIGVSDLESSAEAAKNRAYSIDTSGKLRLAPFGEKDNLEGSSIPDPKQAQAALNEAIADKIVNPASIPAIQKNLDEAKAKFDQAVRIVGNYGKIQAALRGAGRMGAFTLGASAGAIPGAEVGAWGGAAFGPEGVPVGAAIGGTAGSLAGGTLIAASYDKTLQDLAPYFESIKKANLAAQLHPDVSEASELLAFAIAPTKLFSKVGVAERFKPALLSSIQNYGKLYDVAANRAGTAEAALTDSALSEARQIAGTKALMRAGAEATGGAAMFTAMQSAFDLKIPTARDIMVNEALALGLHGNGLHYGKVNAEGMESVMVRGMVRLNNKIPLGGDSDAHRAALEKAYADSGVNLSDPKIKEQLMAPMTGGEVALYRDAALKTSAIIQGDKSPLFKGGEHVSMHGMFGKEIPIAAATVEAEGEGRPSESPDVQDSAAEAEIDAAPDSGRARVLKDIADGTVKDIDTLTPSELNSIGLDRPQGSDKLVPFKPLDADGKPGPPMKPDVHVDDKGNILIRDHAKEDLARNGFPATADVIRPEAEAHAQFNPKAEGEAIEPPQAAPIPPAPAAKPHPHQDKLDKIDAALKKSGYVEGAAPTTQQKFMLEQRALVEKGKAIIPPAPTPVPSPKPAPSPSPSTPRHGDVLRKWASNPKLPVAKKNQAELVSKALDNFANVFSGVEIKTAKRGSSGIRVNTEGKLLIDPDKFLAHTERKGNRLGSVEKALAQTFFEERTHRSAMLLDRDSKGADTPTTDKDFADALDKMWASVTDETKNAHRAAYFKDPSKKFDSDWLAKHEWFADIAAQLQKGELPKSTKSAGSDFLLANVIRKYIKAVVDWVKNSPQAIKDLMETTMEKLKQAEALLEKNGGKLPSEKGDIELASDYEKMPVGDLVSSIEAFHEDPNDENNWPADIRSKHEKDPLKEAVDNGDYDAAYPHLPVDVRNQPQKKKWFDNIQRTKVLQDRVDSAQEKFDTAREKIASGGEPAKKAFWSLFPGGDEAHYNSLPKEEGALWLSNREAELSSKVLSSKEANELDNADNSEAEEWLGEKGPDIAAGPYIEQVQARAEEAKKRLGDLGYKWDKGAGSFEDVRDEMPALFSDHEVSKEDDEAYMHAVRHGDKDTQQRMVDAAACIETDEHGKDIVWRDGAFSIAVDDPHDTKYITLWKNGVRGKIGSLRLIPGRESNTRKYAVIADVEILPQFRGKRLGQRLYETARDFVGPKYQGIASENPDRANKKQVPKIWQRIGAESTAEGNFYLPRMGKMDPITYKDGKPIPLSKRFNPNSDSILYSDPEDIDTLAHKAATSPHNDLAEPTDAQKDVGNYKMGHVTIGGMDFSIENPAGSRRSPQWPPLKDHYGYAKLTEGADGDHMDAFIKPGTPSDYDGPVYVVNQKKADGTFDEHKAIIGAGSPDDAKSLYQRNFSKGWKGMGSVAEFKNIAKFRDWAEDHVRRAPAKGSELHEEANHPVKAPEKDNDQFPNMRFSGWLNPSGGWEGLNQPTHEEHARVKTGVQTGASDQLYKGGWMRVVPYGDDAIMANTPSGKNLTPKQESELKNRAIEGGFQKVLFDNGKDRPKVIWNEEPALASDPEEKPTENIDRERLKELGYTNDIREAGYVTPEGKLIDLSGKREGGSSGTRSYDHHEAGGTKGMQEFMNEGNIRLQSSGANIMRKLTTGQEKVLRDMIERNNGDVVIDLERGLGRENEDYYSANDRNSIEFPEGTSAKKILGVIRRYYNGENFGDKEMFSDPEEKERQDFYSQLGKTLEEKMPKVASSEQIKGIINNPQNRIKADEIKWSGIVPWLEGKKRVTKAEVQDYLKNEGAVKFEEHNLQTAHKPEDIAELKQRIQKGIDNWDEDLLPENEWPGHHDDAIEAQHEGESALEALDDSRFNDAVDHIENASRLEMYYGDNPAWQGAHEFARRLGNPEGAAKYSQYQLPGGEHYREVVLTMPVKPDTGVDESRARELYNIDQDNWGRSEGRAEWDSLSKAEQMAKVAGSQQLKATREAYTSSHFSDVPNYVAHMRTNERKVDAPGFVVRNKRSGFKSKVFDTEQQANEYKDKLPESLKPNVEVKPQGKKSPGLFIEEMQSDRHQQGREKGYKSPDDVAEMAKLKKRWEVVVAERAKASGAEYASLHGEELFLIDQMNALHDKGQTGVPDAPFRQSSQWGLQLFKRALRDAVKSGKDWIGWTSGDTQADRYDLSKQLSEVKATRSNIQGDTKNTVQVEAYDKSGEQVISKRILEEDLADTVGKDLANKILQQPLGDKHSYAGLNLKVGGEGMHSFYDKILPNEIGKYVKQWGGAVEKGEVPTQESSPSQPGIDENGNSTLNTPIHKVTITPEMSKGIREKGQALFAEPEKDDKGYATGGMDYQMGRQRLVKYPPTQQGHREWDSNNHPASIRSKKWRYKNGTISWENHEPNAKDIDDVEHLLRQNGLLVKKHKLWPSGDMVGSSASLYSDPEPNEEFDRLTKFFNEELGVPGPTREEYDKAEAQHLLDLAGTPQFTPGRTMPYDVPPDAHIGIRRAVTDAVREEHNWVTYVNNEPAGFKHWYKEAQKIVAEDPLAGTRLVDELAQRPKPTNAIEAALLTHEMGMRRAKEEEAIDRLRNAKSDIDRIMATQGVAAASDSYIKLLGVTDLAGTDLSHGFNARRMMLKDDFSLARLHKNGEAALRAESGKKRELSQEDIDNLTKVADLVKHETDLHEREQLFAQRNAEMEKTLQLAKTGRGPSIRTINPMREKGNAALERIRDRMKAAVNATEELAAEPEEDEHTKDIIDFGASLVGDGHDKSDTWAKAMEEAVPGILANHSPDELFKASKKAFDDAKEHEGKPAGVMEKIKAARPKAEDMNNLDMNKLALSLIQTEGHSEVEPLMKRMHEEVLKHYPDTTEDQIGKAWTNLENPTYPNPDPAHKVLRDLRAQEASILNRKIVLNDNRIPKPRGPQRDDLSGLARLRQRELKDAIKDSGLQPELSPEKQLASTQSRIQKALENRRDDLQRQIDAGKRDPKSNTPTEDTPENKKLREEVAMLNGKLNVIDPRNTGPTDEQRIKMSESATVKSIDNMDKEIADLERQVKAGTPDPEKPKKPALTSPELERLRKIRDTKREARDELKDQLEDLRALKNPVADPVMKVLKRMTDRQDKYAQAGPAKPKRNPAKTERLAREYVKNGNPQLIKDLVDAGMHQSDAEDAKLILDAERNRREMMATDAWHRRNQKAIERYAQRAQEADEGLAPQAKSKRQLNLDQRADEALFRRKNAEREALRAVEKLRLSQRSNYRTTADFLLRWRRALVLADHVVLAKLAGVAFWRQGFTPIEEAIGGVASNLFPGLADNAPRNFGFSAKAEAEAITQSFKYLVDNFGKVIKTGRSTMDVKYSEKPEYNDLDPSIADYIGHSHAAIKLLPKANEFYRSYQKRVESRMRQGLDVTSPAAQQAIGAEAYLDANRAIFMQPNWLSDGFREMMTKWSKSEHFAANVAGDIGNLLLPIVKVPSNILFETLGEYVGGLARAGVKTTGLAWKAARENDGRTYGQRLQSAFSKLPPEQAEAFLRHIKKGTLGNALILLTALGGATVAQLVGGIHVAGDKRDEKDTPEERLRLTPGGPNLPKFAFHNPVFDALHYGESLYRYFKKASDEQPMALAKAQAKAEDAETKLTKAKSGNGIASIKLARARLDEANQTVEDLKDPKNTNSLAWNALKTFGLVTASLADKTPVVGGMSQTAEMIKDTGFGHYLRNELPTSIIPTGVSNIAKDTDKAHILDEPIKRQADTVGEHFMAKIPGLRSTLPRKDNEVDALGFPRNTPHDPVVAEKALDAYNKSHPLTTYKIPDLKPNVLKGLPDKVTRDAFVAKVGETMRRLTTSGLKNKDGTSLTTKPLTEDDIANPTQRTITALKAMHLKALKQARESFPKVPLTPEEKEAETP